MCERVFLCKSHARVWIQHACFYSVDKAKDQKSMETSEGLQDKSIDEAKAGPKIVKNEILKHLWSLFWLHQDY